ncbi:MAG: twin-arginine translocase TatA/TatE family subunit [Pseudobdellovibrionaceae bacterium]|jgi:sec-independent protein translocase protein TatB|nr:twin-arginine translocase TatA/TatE family subunit [Pseudobdellovibrionaceae bacterium]
MLDFSWSELLIVLLVAILAIGPKQIPDVLYALGRIVRRMQYMRFALTKQFDDFMLQSDLKEMQDLTKQMGMPKTSALDEMEDDEMHALPPKSNEKPQNRDERGDHGSK